MRILLVMNKCNLPSRTLHRIFVPSLRAAGHDVICVDQWLLASIFGVSGAQRLLVDYAKAYRPAVALTNPPYDMISHETTAAWRALGVASIGYRYDDPIFLTKQSTRGDLLRRQFAEAGGRFDLIASTSREAVAYMQGIGVSNAAYLRLAISPVPVGKAVQSARPVSFIGSAYLGENQGTLTDRIDILKNLVAGGVDLAVYGKDWEQVPDLKAHHFGYVPAEDLFSLYRHTPINLSINGWLAPMIKLRLLEIAAAGGFQIVDETPDLHEYFSPDEMLAVRDRNSLLQAIQDTLASPEERDRRSRLCTERVLRDHTWATRWPEAMSLLSEQTGNPVSDSLHAIDTEAARPLVLAQLAIGHLSESREYFPLAWQAFSDALSLDPQDYSAHAGLARIAERMQRFGLAFEHWDQARLGFAPTWTTFQDHNNNAFATHGQGLHAYGEPHLDAAVAQFHLACAAGDEGRLQQVAPDVALVAPELLTPMIPAFRQAGRTDLATWLQGLVQG